MRLCIAKAVCIGLVTLLGSIVASSHPAMAAPKNLQWRSTDCQSEQEKKVIAYWDCQVAFTQNGTLFAVKINKTTGESVYFQIGKNGAYSGGDECLSVKYDEALHGGVIESYCIVKTAWELGIKGAPRAFSQPPSSSGYTPSYAPSPSPSNGDLRFKTMVRCGRAFPGHLYQNHPDKYGHKTCMKMAGYD